ncbi:MAG: response regulator [Planctomycetia bacterium]|jgi:putative two-component system response regulator|nr:response regulator [Planctomycetia bacterium]MCC7316848.1 response regulator [Planctomycetota bacterium]OQY99866.1 MAG: two-component system response regulator [Planctomycetes bacterium UTPLA1]
MRVLIVDDDVVALEALRHALTSAGHDVDVAEDGSEALTAFVIGHHHLVISDWVMPNMDGLELCRQIRRQDITGYVYFILLTSKGGTHNIVEGLSAGADEFLTKPFEPAELRARVRAAERVLSLETRDMAMIAMARLAESRDPETGEHLERVRQYSRVLALQLSLSPEFNDIIDLEFIHLIYMTSPLHDIGKVGIPDQVLLKPGKLTREEFEIMKTHTTIGAKTLDSVLQSFPEARFLKMARDIALTHHEWFNGAGYPDKLRGSQIPLSGRIVAVADVYDALTSKRPYKDAYDHDTAVEMILTESRRHFDPALIKAFVAQESEFVEIKRRCAESHANLVMA